MLLGFEVVEVLVLAVEPRFGLAVEGLKLLFEVLLGFLLAVVRLWLLVLWVIECHFVEEGKKGDV